MASGSIAGWLRVLLVLVCTPISHCGHREPGRVSAVTVPAAPGASSSPVPTVVSKRDEDDDGDGIPNAEDFCLAAAEDIDRCDDEDGCPEDDDHDGTADSSDDCRHKEGPAHNKGCPVPLPSGTVLLQDSEDHCLILNPVPFQKGSATPSADGETAVGWMVDCMANEPTLLVVELLGYSSPQEGAPDLGLERARAVQSALVARGIDSRRLRVGRGDPARPIGIHRDPYSVQFLVLRSLSCPASLDYLKD